MSLQLRLAGRGSSRSQVQSDRHRIMVRTFDDLRGCFDGVQVANEQAVDTSLRFSGSGIGPRAARFSRFRSLRLTWIHLSVGPIATLLDGLPALSSK
jgi:hypothetical protein